MFSSIRWSNSILLCLCVYKCIHSMYHSCVLKSENNVHVLVFAVLHCMRQDSFVTVLGSLDGPSASGNSVIAPRCMFTDSGFFLEGSGDTSSHSQSCSANDFTNSAIFLSWFNLLLMLAPRNNVKKIKPFIIFFQGRKWLLSAYCTGQCQNNDYRNRSLLLQFCVSSCFKNKSAVEYSQLTIYFYT